MRIIFCILLVTLYSILNAQEPDSVKLSAVLINYSALHAEAPDFGPDTMLVQYNKDGNETQRILTSRITESSIGVPIIFRSQYDSLGRAITEQSYGFSTDYQDSTLNLRDTSWALMDTFESIFSYTDSTQLEQVNWIWTNEFGEKYTTYYFKQFDSLDRVIYEYEENEKKVKANETYTTFTDSITARHRISRHSTGKVYSDIKDTIFYDKDYKAIKQVFHNDDKNLKYKTWSICGNCTHWFYRDSNGKVKEVIWKSPEGQALMEIQYINENDKIIGKRKHDLKKGKAQSEWYEYDHQGNISKYEYFRRGKLDRWQKVEYKYQAKKK